MTAAEIVTALACSRPGCDCARAARKGSGDTHCPAHADGKPSLSVSERTGVTLVHCQSGCSQDAVIAALVERGLWGSPPSRNGHVPSRPVVPTRTTDYQIKDSTGRPVAIHRRTEHANGKTFSWLRPDGSTGLNGTRSAALPLYRSETMPNLPEGAPVVLVEGEKCADALAAVLGPKVGVLATVTGAAACPSDEVLSVLAGRRVVLWPDADQPGRQHMERIAEALQRIGAAEVKVVAWPDPPEHGDAADFLIDHGREEVLGLLKAAVPFVPSETRATVQPLTELPEFLEGFVAFPSPEARDAVALWVTHTHAVEAAATTPRLSIRSAEKQCGKSRLLEVLELVTARPVLAVNISVAALFRSIGEPPPAILWDEVDALFRGGNDPGREDLRALLNSGYRRGASVLRMVGEGKKMEVRAFPTFAPVALAGIGNLPDTINDRSILVELRRRLPGEKVRPFRRRTAEPEAAALRERLAAWASENVGVLERARPNMPDGLSDRAQDLWEPLLAIADVAGGSWPERARKAAVELAQVGQDQDGSRGVLLLADLRDIFGRHGDPEAIPTAQLIEELVALEESPWGDLRGRPLDARGLAYRLRPYKVRPAVVRLGAVTARCYRRCDLAEPWERYTPPRPAGTVTSVTDVTSAAPELSAQDQTPPDVSDVTHVTVPQRGGRAEAQAPSVPARNGHRPPTTEGLEGQLDLIPLEALATGPDEVLL